MQNDGKGLPLETTWTKDIEGISLKEKVLFSN